MKTRSLLRGARASAAVLAACAVLLALTAPPSSAQTAPPVPGLRPPRPGGSDSSSAEGIGSLPIVAAPAPSTPVGTLLPPELLGPGGHVRPYVVVIGRKDAIEGAVSNARGNGIVTIHPPAVIDPNDEDAGAWVVGFHGDVAIDFDSDRLDGVEVEMRVGTEFSGGVASACWNGLCTAPVLLSGPALELPLATFVADGSLLVDKVGIQALSALQTHAELEVRLVEQRIVRVFQELD